MRGAELPRLVDALRGPIRVFVRESRARIALLVSGAGQVLAQHGFARGYHVMNVASLAAATHASSRALATLSGAGRWEHLYHGGRERQLFLAPLRTPVEELILVVIFDADSSLGIVRLFYENLEKEVAALPEFQDRPDRADHASFEQDLEAGLEYTSPEAASED
ncbi:MAG TPA: roadblock/LC7 domain-containing protein [Longimicrobiales bacterium]|nr:roadblock/LC7 domain-containing protein [Longimicrobiales bacterium]